MQNTHQKQDDLGNAKKLIENYCSSEWQYLIDIYTTYKEYKKDEIIFKEGEKIRSIHIIESGRVKVFATFDNDKERIIRLAADQHIIGHRGIGEDFTYSATAIALTPVKLSLIPFEVFQKALKANSEFCYHFMLFFAEELRKSERHIKQMETMSLTQKVAKALIMNLDAFGYDKKQKTLLNGALSRKDFSKITGSTYESIVRTLSTFNEEEIIKTDGKKIYILKEQELRQMIQSPSNFNVSFV